MKRTYIKPILEAYQYNPEEGFAVSIGLYNKDEVKDYVLIEGEDRNSRLASDELTEFTDHSGEYELGLWE